MLLNLGTYIPGCMGATGAMTKYHMLGSSNSRNAFYPTSSVGQKSEGRVWAPREVCRGPGLTEKGLSFRVGGQRRYLRSRGFRVTLLTPWASVLAPQDLLLSYFIPPSVAQTHPMCVLCEGCVCVCVCVSGSVLSNSLRPHGL